MFNLGRGHTTKSISRLSAQPEHGLSVQLCAQGVSVQLLMSLHQKKKKKKGVPTLFEVRVTEDGPLGLPLVPCAGNNNMSAMLSKEPEPGHAVARTVLLDRAPRKRGRRGV